MRMINKLVEPTSGHIRIDGEDIAGIPAYELRRRIGYAIQGHGLFPHRTVGQNIATVPKLLGWDKPGSPPRRRTAGACSNSNPPSSAIACRMNCRAASSSASASPGPSRPSPRYC
jgi:hypothetical protein